MPFVCAPLASQPQASLPPDLAGDDFMEHGIDVALRTGADEQGAEIAVRLALRWVDRGELTRADDLAAQSLEGFPGAKGPARARLHCIRAELARERRDLSEALEAIAAGEGALGEGPEYEAVRMRLAGTRLEVHLRQGLLELAAADVEVLERLADRRPDGTLTALFYWLRYGLAVEDFEGIARRITAARVSGVAGLERPHVAAQLLMYEGVALAELAREGRPVADAARAALEEGLRQHPAPKAKASMELALADLALRDGDPDGARVRLASVAEQLEQEGADASPHHTGDLASLRSQLAFAEDADRATHAACHAALVAAFRDLVGAWEDVPTSPGGIGFLHHGNRRRVVSELVRTSLTLGGPADALPWLLEAQQQSTLVRRLAAPPVDLDVIRRTLLDGDAGVLVYLPSLERSHVFAIDKEQILHAELAALDEIAPLRQDLQAELFRSPAGLDDEQRARRGRNIRRLGRELADRVLPGPIRARAAGWSQVLVCGGELLGNVPFEALNLHLAGEVDAPLLGTEWALSSLPSLPLGCFLENRRAARSGATSELDCLLLAAPELGPGSAPPGTPKEAGPARFSAELAALPALRFEAAQRAALTAGFDPARVRVLSHARASFTALCDATRSRPRVLEFLTHTLHDAQRERSAALVLSPEAGAGRFLWCEDVETLASPPLVVLFSCATARAVLRPGDEGSNQLGGAFLIAGAQCVVSSRAALAYEAVLSLGATFHERLVRGASPAEALRQARRALAQAPSTRDPFYWATIEAVGLGHRPLF